MGVESPAEEGHRLGEDGVDAAYVLRYCPYSSSWEPSWLVPSVSIAASHPLKVWCLMMATTLRIALYLLGLLALPALWAVAGQSVVPTTPTPASPSVAAGTGGGGSSSPDMPAMTAAVDLKNGFSIAADGTG